MGWALIRGWALINFFCLWDGRLFEVGANSRRGAYSNKYGIFFFFCRVRYCVTFIVAVGTLLFVIKLIR